LRISSTDRPRTAAAMRIASVLSSASTNVEVQDISEHAWKFHVLQDRRDKDWPQRQM
jgi:hypothetical protein